VPAEVRVSLGDLWRFYVPLCALLRHAAAKPEGRRVVVGIAGPPGSGKSVFAALLKAILDTASVQSAVVSLDGYHFPNAYLDTHYTSDAEGAPQPLRRIKGSPETFDVNACADAVGRLHTEPALRLPAYDRLVHDPVEGRILVGPEHRLALVEGNYLLLEADGWRTLRDVLDLAIFLVMPLEAVRSRLIARHMRGGRSREDSERHFELVDMGNWNLCMGSARRADLTLERDADFGVVRVGPPQVRPGPPAAEV